LLVFEAIVRTCVYIDKLPEAEDSLRTGLKLFPDYVNCSLGLAAVLLMKNEEPGTLAEAKQLLEAAGTPVFCNGSYTQTETLAFCTAVHAALTGEVVSSYRTLLELGKQKQCSDRAQKALKLFEF
jgi:hypothetical protein